MSLFIRAMTAAAENRRQATTAFEIADAEQWMATVMRANSRGEDMEQFIPRADQLKPELEVLHPLLDGPAFEDVGGFDPRAAQLPRGDE